jgi:competence protein ComEA
MQVGEGLRCGEGGVSAARLRLLLGLPLQLDEVRAEDLERLPGIGRALARDIVAFRDQHGPLSRLDPLAGIPGIGPKRLALLQRWLTP